MKQLITLFILAGLFAGCGNSDQKTPVATKPDTVTKQVAPPPTASISGLTVQDSVKAIGRQVLIQLKNQNYTELVKYFSNGGVLFSPYAYIDTAKNKKLIAEDFLEAIHKNWTLTWGSYDGTGDPIKLSVKSYLKKFVYNADYINAEAVGFNKVMQEGNSQNNITSIYPHHQFIDYYFSGFKQESKGTDWTSLRLVFDKVGNEFFLVAIIHDQWTI